MRPSPWPCFRSGSRSLPGAPDPTVQSEIEAFCRREGVPFLDLLPALRPLGEAAFVDYDHLSIAGAARVAETLAASAILPKVPTEGEVLAARFRSTGHRRSSSSGRHSPTARSGCVPRRPGPSSSGRRTRPRPRPPCAGPCATAARWSAPGPRVPSVRLGPRPTLRRATLFALLADDVQEVRWQAALALSKLGLHAPEAVAPLAAALAEPRPLRARVRGLGAWATSGPRRARPCPP